jgi:hypothetical protein
VTHFKTAAALAVLLLTSAAKAAPATSRDPRPLEARKACLAGNVARGIELLAEIVVENGDPNAIYNQARCYQQNGRAAEAVTRFREYLRVARNVNPADRAQVEGYIEELEADLARPPAAPQVTVAATPSPPAPAPTPPASSGLGPLRGAAWAAGGLGLIGLGTGAYFGWRTADTTRAIERDRGPTSPGTLDRRLSDGQRFEVLQWVGYGVGAAALLGSAVLFYVSRPVQELYAPGERLSLVPALVPGGGGASLAGRF